MVTTNGITSATKQDDKRRPSGISVKSVDQSASVCSVNSVAVNYSNGGTTGNIPNDTTDYLWRGNQVLEERDPFGGTGSTDTPIRQYIWGTYIDELIQLTTLTTLGAQNVPAGAYYLLQDLLYRAVALTDLTGTIVEAYDTDAYGQTIIYTGPGPDYLWFTDDDAGSGFTYGANDMIFCGYRYDPETRLYYVRNRMFLTDVGGISVGRWLQRDPIGYAGGINLYEYVAGNPIGTLDTLGLDCCSALKATYDAAEAAAEQARKELLQALADANKWLMREQRDMRLVDIYKGKAKQWKLLYDIESAIVMNLMKEEDTDPNAVTPGALSEAQHLQIKYLNDYQVALAEEKNARAAEITAQRWQAYWQSAVSAEKASYIKAINRAFDAREKYRNCLKSGSS